ncbi:MAG: ANTAR domain-containing protein, partial [Bacteroidota bacterium]
MLPAGSATACGPVLYFLPQSLFVHDKKNDLIRLFNNLSERKTLDRAKGILMKRRGCGEDEAF